MTQSRYFIPGLIMLLAACAAALLTPTQKMADVESRIELERLIPLGFGDWKIDTSLVPVKVDPALQASLNKIYNQTLSRTYINSQGQRIMLSIAYGGDREAICKSTDRRSAIPLKVFRCCRMNRVFSTRDTVRSP
jgi:hypothetical protein